VVYRSQPELPYQVLMSFFLTCPRCWGLMCSNVWNVLQKHSTFKRFGSTREHAWRGATFNYMQYFGSGMLYFIFAFFIFYMWHIFKLFWRYPALVIVLILIFSLVSCLHVFKFILKISYSCYRFKRFWIYRLLIVVSVMQLMVESIVYISFFGGGSGVVGDT